MEVKQQVRVRVCVCVCERECMCVYIRVCVYMRVRMYVWACVYVCVSECTCLYHIINDTVLLIYNITYIYSIFKNNYINSFLYIKFIIIVNIPVT